MDVYNGDYTDIEGRKQGWPEEFLRKNTETTEAQREGFTAAHTAGVPIVYGTDACIYPHGLNARQFPIMVERGMTPMEAIQAATSVAAKYMGWSDRVGSIEPGRYGDVIAVKATRLPTCAGSRTCRSSSRAGRCFGSRPAEQRRSPGLCLPAATARISRAPPSRFKADVLSIVSIFHSL